MAIESINPATGLLLRSFDAISDEAAKEKVALAAEAFRSYSTVPLEHRALWMRKLAAILENDLNDLAILITQEMGKPLASSRLELLKCAEACRYFADNAARILSPESIPTADSHSYVRWDPLGVILAVMPWNFPFWQVFRFLAPALMAGNVGLLKHAPSVPQCALAIESLVRRAGFPRGTFQNLFLETSQVEAILSDERIAAVTLTGGETAGRSIGAQAGWHLKKSVLELGGSDPFIVMPSADLDLAIETAVRARCVNSGQSCIAAKRFIVHDSVYEPFTRRFVAAMSAQRVGDPTQPTTQIGPLAAPKILETLLSQIEAAKSAGGTVLCGGERLEGLGNYIRPTVIANVPPPADVAKQEPFGPLALLFKVSSIEDAIALANDTPFGLGASVWTNALTEQQRFVSDLQSGSVFVNALVSSDPRIPFGGIKHSGYGRELSVAGMKEFMNAKTVIVAERPGTLRPQPTLFED